MTYISMVKAGEAYYIVCNEDDMCLLGFESRSDGLRYYEDAYNRGHRRSYESSMSACINYMHFQPSIVEAPDLKELEGLVGEKPKPFRLSHISGFMTGLKVPDDYGKRLWDAGERPKLIDQSKL